MSITQGKLVLGLNVNVDNFDQQFDVMIYNSILGGTASSKLFQNVREKASLAYTAGSNFMKVKNIILVRCGIEIKNYDKALKIVKEQLEQMKDDEFTDQDVEIAKKSLIDSIQTIDDEQDTEILYYFRQQFAEELLDIQQYIERIKRITKVEVLNVAKKINIDTIYFLTNANA